MKHECELYLAPKTPRATDAMDVKLAIIREIIFNDKRDLNKGKYIQSVTKIRIMQQHA